MTAIKQDKNITPVSVTKIRKKVTDYRFGTERSIEITYDTIAIDDSGNEVYYISKQNIIEIPKARFSETLIAACIQATKDMVQNEFQNQI